MRDMSRAFTMLERACEGWTYEAIGAQYSLTRERVRQIIAKTLRFLLERLAGDPLPQDFSLKKRLLPMHKDFWLTQITKARAALPDYI